MLYLSGPVGDAGAGIELLRAGEEEPAALIDSYRLPTPQLTVGQALAPLAHATMDISDGFLIDARRMAEASGCAIEITAIPLSSDYTALHGISVASRLAAATAGDDYVLLAALAPDVPPPEGLVVVGRCAKGAGITVVLDGAPVMLPDRLGYEHGPARSASADQP
jgi:thiamine-monophosphate kinase